MVGTGIFPYIYHVGCIFNLYSIINNGLIPGGQDLSKRQTVFFLPIDPRDKNHKDPEHIDFSVPRRARWDVGIVYCTCGHFLRDDTTENKKYIKSVLHLFSIPNVYIRKGRPHGHRYGKKEGDQEDHTANQIQKK